MGAIVGVGMHAKIEHAIRQALDARQRAAACVDAGAQDEWLKVARKWDELASSYEEFQKVRDSYLSALVEPRPK
jgi:hypothetical protein